MKRFPQHLDYLKVIVDEWLRNDVLLVAKSRRMVVTWTCLALQYWVAVLNVGRAVFIGSRKEESSEELISRIWFMHNNLPQDKLFIKPRATRKFCRIDFPGLGSYIQGIPQGGDQLRQYTASSVLFDEFAFWEEAEQSWVASKPTLEGGGKILIVSSPASSFFEKMVHGKLGSEVVQ